MSVKEVMTNLADAARARYSVSDKLTVADITDLIQGENADVAKLIDRSITKIEIPEGVTEIGKEAFRGCSQLTEVTLPSTITSIGENAFADCDALAVIYCGFTEGELEGAPWGAPENVLIMYKTVEAVVDNPLTFTKVSDSHTEVVLRGFDISTKAGLYYRTDKEKSFSRYTLGDRIVLDNVGDYVQFQNTAYTLNALGASIRFSAPGTVVSGDMQSMLNGSESCSPYCFYGLFSNSGVADVSDLVLSASNTAEGCYANMFERNSFTTPPKVYASILARRSCECMFQYCRYLTETPELPQTWQGERCCDSMFLGCSDLITISPIRTLFFPKFSCINMFRDCAGLKEIPQISGYPDVGSFRYMFSGCRNATGVARVIIPDGTMPINCCIGMLENTAITAAYIQAAYPQEGSLNQIFNGCEDLSVIEVNFSHWQDETLTPGFFEDVCANWVSGVASSGTFTCPSALPEEFGDSRIPSGWTVVRKD